MQWSFFLHLIELVTIHHSLSSHRTMILATKWACHQAPKVHCTNSHNMLHMLVMKFYQFRKNTFMLFSKKFAHEIHEVFKDQYLKQLTKVDFHDQFEINDTKQFF
jgi:hypothetical protein